ncbi:unnamed protein product [Mycena citricolor]|uniref:Uncharacterized protein n=1 Tax=Mycena citricolor TaxID=2018698 RepID=A0AAD2GSI1_9AGAR|nr:unnamed protein product [Mycena citricolor]
MSTDAVAVAALGQVHASSVPPPQAGSPQVRLPTTVPGHFFARASDVEVSGGNFLTASRDIHYHTVRIGGGNEAGDRGSLKKRSSAGASTAARSMNEANGNIMLEPYGDYSQPEIYASHLSRQQRGFPLYFPSPQDNLPEEYKMRGVCIGDVGCVTPEGIFDFFFNVYLPADHPINRGFVPAGFVPLEPYTARDIFLTNYCPRTYVVSPSVVKPRDPDSFPNELLFECQGPSGALLVLPHGSHLEKLRNVERIRKYGEKNAENWYRYVNGPRGRHMVNGSLYLVTGSEKAQSGSMATFHSPSLRENFPLLFRDLTQSDSDPIYHFGGSAHSQSFFAPLENGRRPENQTIFIHGFTISLGEGIIGRRFGRVGLASIGDSPQKRHSKFVPFVSGNNTKFPFSFFGIGRHGRRAKDEDAVIISQLSPSPQIVHPSQILNEFILQQSPKASVVITHDDDWCDILEDDGTANAVQSVVAFLQQICERFDIASEGGARYLIPKTSRTSTHRQALSLADPQDTPSHSKSTRSPRIRRHSLNLPELYKYEDLTANEASDDVVAATAAHGDVRRNSIQETVGTRPSSPAFESAKTVDAGGDEKL